MNHQHICYWRAHEKGSIISTRFDLLGDNANSMGLQTWTDVGQRELGWIGAWNFAAMAREDHYLRAHFPTGSSFFLSKRNLSDVGVVLYCIQWRSCKFCECVEGKEERRTGEEEEERRCFIAGSPSPPTPRSFPWYPSPSLSFVGLLYK
jgi:hypothetical protein